MRAPFCGDRLPVLGDKVYIDFGDGLHDHPEVEGVVSFISDEHISVLFHHHDHKRFKISDCKHIEILE